MPFFKLLSENPEDYESDESPEPIPKNDPEFEDHMFASEGRLELLLDTGELFCVPLDWLIAAARHYNFHRDIDHKGVMH